MVIDVFLNFFTLCFYSIIFCKWTKLIITKNHEDCFMLETTTESVPEEKVPLQIPEILQKNTCVGSLFKKIPDFLAFRPASSLLKRDSSTGVFLPNLWNLW